MSTTARRHDPTTWTTICKSFCLRHTYTYLRGCHLESRLLCRWLGTAYCFTAWSRACIWSEYANLLCYRRVSQVDFGWVFNLKINRTNTPPNTGICYLHMLHTISPKHAHIHPQTHLRHLSCELRWAKVIENYLAHRRTINDTIPFRRRRQSNDDIGTADIMYRFRKQAWMICKLMFEFNCISTSQKIEGSMYLIPRRFAWLRNCTHIPSVYIIKINL